MKRTLIEACLIASLTWSCKNDVSPCPLTEPDCARVTPPARSQPAPTREATQASIDGDRAIGPDAGVPKPALAFSLGIPHEHLRAVDHLARARLLDREGDHAGAVAELRRGVYDNADDLDALELLGRITRRHGMLDLAVAAYRRIEADAPAEAIPAIRLARIHLTRSEFDEARVEAEEALRRNPSSSEAAHLLGRAHLSQGALNEAIAALQKATDLDPGHAWAFNNLGYAYLLANENEKSAEALEEAVALKPDVASIWNNLGLAWERLGRTLDASAAYSKALELKPRYVKAKINSHRTSRVAEAQDPALDVPVASGARIDSSPDAGPGEDPPATTLGVHDNELIEDDCGTF